MDSTQNSMNALLKAHSLPEEDFHNPVKARTSTPELTNLDLLRTVAVLFVFAAHTLQPLLHAEDGTDSRLGWLGRLGVLYFFVHTACVLMMSLDRHRGPDRFVNFYVRRFFRIYPLSMVAVGLVAAFRLNPDIHVRAFLANLALIQNLTFSQDAFPSIWTLPIEVQMYVVLPFIFLLVKRVRHSQWIVPAVLYALSVVLADWIPKHIARASVLLYAPNFLPGVLAYCLFRMSVRKVASYWLPVLLLVITGLFLIHPGWHAPAWAACGVLGLSLPYIRQIRLLSINRLTATIARYSYGIYIVHSLVLMFMVPTWATLPAYLGIVSVASVLAYHFVEHPLIQLGGRAVRLRERHKQRKPAAV